MDYRVAGIDIYRFDIQTNGTVNGNVSYGASTLSNVLTQTERGFNNFELKDKQGRVTHKFQELDSGNYAITAYCFDEKNGGRLAYIIPPETYNKFATGKKQSFSEGDSLYNEGVYSYKFNTIGNLVEKHIPGGGTTRYILDKHDRIVMENDSKDYTTLWKFTKFDALGRPIIKGILTNLGAKTRQEIQTDFDNFGNINTNFAYEESTNSGGLYNYTNRSFPSVYTVFDANIKEVIYYDNYSQIDTTGYGFKPAKAFHAQGLTVGLVTGKLIRNLKTGTWQKQIFYYDYRGKLIQEFHLTNRNNIIRKDYQYRFNGELLKIRIEKKNSSNVILSTKILTWEYDHLGRKVGYIYNGKPIVKYFYDAIGRLQIKKFSPSGITQSSKQTGNWTNSSSWLSGILPTLADNVTINTGQTLTIPSGETAFAGVLNDKGTLKNFGTLNMGKVTSADLYTQNYFWHIRGGLKGINLDVSGNLTNNLFSYKLDYENGANGLFDGNISKQSWKSNIDNKERSYTFSYDGASRLKSGTYASIPAGENYSLNNVDYDLNGNIKALSRSGATNTNYTAFNNVDNLTYTYQNYSNKLLKIADATNGNADLGDFRDGTNTDDDYEYWADGSLKRDKNKKISSITYNYLKLPEIITFDDNKTITTEYDASGTKLKKIVSGGETTDYEEDDIYVNNVLYQTSHDEGRIANGIFEYNITDHNNDLRIAFKDSSGIAVPTQSIFYDPWGLSMKGMSITRNPLNFNKYQFLNREIQIETGLVDLINRQYNPQTGRFLSQDPIIEGQEHLSLYQYGWNNPVLRPDPNGDCPLCPLAIPFLPEIGIGLAAAGEAITGLFVGGATGTAIGVGFSGMADSKAFIPYSVQMVAHKVESEMSQRNTNTQTKSSPPETNKQKSGDSKTHQTYTKDPSKDGVYSGKTSGKGTPEQNVAKRDKGHHMNDTHERAKLDRTSSKSDAIRGQEQRNIDKNGGSKSQGGTSGNQNNGISPTNKKREQYLKASENEFGKN